MQWEEFSVQVMGKFKTHPSHCQGRYFETQRRKVNSWIWGSSSPSPPDSNRRTASSVLRKIKTEKRAPVTRQLVLTANVHLYSIHARPAWKRFRLMSLPGHPPSKAGTVKSAH
jgi:hypothetical protein